MSERFSIPHSLADGEAERVFHGLCKTQGVTPPPPDRRIRRLVFRRGGDDIVAEVGQPIRGAGYGSAGVLAILPDGVSHRILLVDQGLRRADALRVGGREVVEVEYYEPR